MGVGTLVARERVDENTVVVVVITRARAAAGAAGRRARAVRLRSVLKGTGLIMDKHKGNQTGEKSRSSSSKLIRTTSSQVHAPPG